MLTPDNRSLEDVCDDLIEQAEYIFERLGKPDEPGQLGQFELLEMAADLLAEFTETLKHIREFQRALGGNLGEPDKADR